MTTIFPAPRRRLLFALSIFWALNLIAQLAITPRLFFLFFTIQSNLLAAIVVTAYAFPSLAGLRWFTRPTVATAAAVYITIVGVGYSLLRLRLNLLDFNLHYLTPIAYLLFWFFCVPKGRLRWFDPCRWLIYPLAYTLFCLTTGINFYWFLTPRYVPILMAIFLALGFCFLGIDRLSGEKGGKPGRS